ncbi:MAG: hypothetical protein ACE5EQ_06340 [Phycisphaerae bacterium]
MNLRLTGMLCAGAWFAVAAGACVPPEDTVSLNSPSLTDFREQRTLGEYFAYHNDQGMMADRSIADIHFIPHTAELSGTGQARLERYAELLSTTGGTLHYDTRLGDADLVELRIASAKTFMSKAVPSVYPIDVVVGTAGGRGMPASESTGGQEVARQPELRGTAYHLRGAVGGTSAGG